MEQRNSINVSHLNLLAYMCIQFPNRSNFTCSFQPLILHVLANIEDTIQSCDCLRVCFDNASVEELVEFQKVLLSLCTAMAKGKYR
jgi:hypothetical protein